MHRKYRLHAAILAIVLFVSACAKRPVEIQTAAPRILDPVQELRLGVNRVLADPAFNNSFWGVSIQSLQTGQVLYEENASKLLMPASNMKLITAAASLKILGPAFTYETQIQTDGEILDGTLTGNLLIIGNGDPTISSRFGEGDHFKVFNQWGARLKELGISAIDGDVVAIDHAFDNNRIGFGWSWDDLPYYYAPETSALQFAENAITVTLIAGQTGDPITIKKEPETSYVMVVPAIRVETNAETRVDWSYSPETRTIYATGTLPPAGQDYGSFSVHNPAAYFASVLKETLIRNGVEVEGEAYRGADRSYQFPALTRPLFSHRSPPLADIISVLLKVSQNLYAETLLKTLGKGKFATGVQEIERALLQMQIPKQNFIITDGSGLSRYNYVTPNGLRLLLHKMRADPQFGVFFNALAVAGVDGTLRSRMKGTSAEKNVHAKTGSLANVRSLSGYARTKDGEWMVFVLIANNFSASPETVQHAQDLILQQLTSFSRSARR